MLPHRVENSVQSLSRRSLCRCTPRRVRLDVLKGSARVDLLAVHGVDEDLLVVLALGWRAVEDQGLSTQVVNFVRCHIVKLAARVVRADPLAVRLAVVRDVGRLQRRDRRLQRRRRTARGRCPGPSCPQSLRLVDAEPVQSQLIARCLTLRVGTAECLRGDRSRHRRGWPLRWSC